jgi:PKHD-type hydroxylase
MIEKKLFSINECKFLLSLSNDKLFLQSKTTKHGGIQVVSNARTSSEVEVDLNFDISSKILKNIKQFGVVSLPSFCTILKYEVGQEIKKHKDDGLLYENRYKTMIIQLSDESEYEGGELCIFENNNEVVASKEIGNVILFNSSMYHSINKIQSGTRYSMIFWLSHSNLGLIRKSLI